MTTQILDFSEIDLTGKAQFGSEAIGSVYYNNERIWPFGVDLLYAGNTAGASYLPDASDTYSSSSLASFGEGVLTVLDEKNGTPVIGPELLVNGNFDTDTSWTKGSGWSISSGQATFSSATAAGIFQAIPVVAGRWYKVTMNVVSMNGYFDFRLGETSMAVATMVGVGERSYVVSATSSSWMAFLIYGPANGSIVIDSVSIREISGLHARQPAVALRPLVGRAPKSRRNLLTFTEEASAAVMVNTTVQSNVTTAPDGTFTADKIVETVVTGAYQNAHGLAGIAGLTYTSSVYLKAGERTVAHIQVGAPAGNPRCTINLITGVVYDVSNCTAGSIDAGNGWWRVWITYTWVTTANNFLYVTLDNGVTSGYTGDGISGLYRWGNQHELGSLTPYQYVGAAVDMIEEGVPSYPFIRFDLSDDRLDTVLPQAVTGDVVIAGRNGSVIAPHSYAANTTFQLGATSYTGGTPGILRAIGDVVGWSILNKTLTAAERERLMRFYKRRGAKGLLVPGPELITNGHFSNGSTGWTLGTGWSVSDGSASRDTTVGGSNLSNGSGVQVGKAYRVTWAQGPTLVAVYLGSVAGPLLSNTDGAGTYSVIAVATQTGGIAFRAANAVSGIDNVSIRELRPEEEW